MTVFRLRADTDCDSLSAQMNDPCRMLKKKDAEGLLFWILSVSFFLSFSENYSFTVLFCKSPQSPLSRIQPGYS